MVGEIHPHWKHLLFTADTHLEQELGLDKSARMELCRRIEKALDIKLDEATIDSATTPIELVRSIFGDTRSQYARPHSSEVASDVSHGNNHAASPGASVRATSDPEQAIHRRAGRWLYTIYAGSVFLTLGLSVWLLMLVTPLEGWRQHIARTSTRLLFRCTFNSLTVCGRNHLDADRPQVVVANHTGYLDGFIITASLGIPIHFIVKAELSRVPLIRLLLQRFGVEFVDRFNARSGAKAIWRITRKSRNGHTLVFFPEGTFTCFEGLQPFRMGAFVAAARANVPVVPVAISGARKILCGKHRLPARGHIDVKILPPIMPDGDSRKDAEKLRDEARRQIGAYCGEPDLVELAMPGK